MVELAIWIVSFIIVVWAIVAIGIPLLILGTAVVLLAWKIVAGIIGVLFIIGATSCYESSPQLALILGILGFGLFIYSLGNTNTEQPKEVIQKEPTGVKMDLERYSNDTDDMFNDAVRIVVDSGKASASLLQHRLRIGYTHAARLVEELEEQGVIGPTDGTRPREVLISSVEEVFGNTVPKT